MRIKSLPAEAPPRRRTQQMLRPTAAAQNQHPSAQRSRWLAGSNVATSIACSFSTPSATFRRFAGSPCRAKPRPFWRRAARDDSRSSTVAGSSTAPTLLERTRRVDLHQTKRSPTPYSSCCISGNDFVDLLGEELTAKARMMPRNVKPDARKADAGSTTRNDPALSPPAPPAERGRAGMGIASTAEPADSAPWGRRVPVFRGSGISLQMTAHIHCALA